MEDEGFVDDDFIADTAREHVIRYGFDAPRMLRERADIAAKADNALLAQAWTEMADLAEQMIVERG